MKCYIWDLLPFALESDLQRIVLSSLRHELNFQRCWRKIDFNNFRYGTAREVALEPG
jgi:hypothetical protein